MDEQTVRQHLAEIRMRLDELDQEREVLLNLLNGYEGWLNLYTSRDGQQAVLMEAPPVRPRQPRNRPKGSVSLRSAVLHVLREARGAPLHTREILLRAQQLGARTTGKEPLGVTDLTAYSLNKTGQPIEKVGPRTWRWAGDEGKKEGGR
jgi:hypothetical protein